MGLCVQNIFILSALLLGIIGNDIVEGITFIERNRWDFFEQVNNKKSLYQPSSIYATSEDHEASNGQFPWMVSLHIIQSETENDLDISLCGGSIISDRWILTAAHCIETAKQIMAIFGDVDNRHTGVHSYQGPGVAMLITQGAVHPEYQEYNKLNDIALLLTPQPIPFGQTIQPIRIAGQNEVYKSFRGKRGLIMGWGGDGVQNQHQILQFGFIPILGTAGCYKNEYTPPGFICTEPDTGVDSCQGDSGSPLLVFSGFYNQFIQIGIVSSGADSSCPSSNPGFFTRVDYYHEWISGVTGIHF